MIAVVLFDGGLGSFGVVVLIVAMEMVVGILFKTRVPVADLGVCDLWIGRL